MSFQIQIVGPYQINDQIVWLQQLMSHKCSETI